MHKIKPFLDAFPVDNKTSLEIDVEDPCQTPDLFLKTLGGHTFGTGIFRVFTDGDSKMWDEFFGQAFPAFNGIIRCVASGWDGRIFAVVTEEREEITPGIAVFDPTTVEAFLLPAKLRELLTLGFLADPEELLASDQYAQWLKERKQIPACNECVGFTVPLFLNGKPTVENRDLTDLEVYWDLTVQLFEQSGE